MRRFLSFAVLALAASAAAQTPTEAWNRFLAEHGPRWNAEWSPATGTPSAIYGQGFRLQDGPIQSVEAARPHAVKLLGRYAALLGRGASSFEERLAERSGNVWSFVYRQRFRGLEVIGGRADLRIHRNGGLSMLGSTAFPVPANFDIVPTLTSESARSTAHQLHDAPLGALPEEAAAGRLVIWGNWESEVASPIRLAWEIDIDHRAAETVGKSYIDAHTGKELSYRNDWHECGLCVCHPQPNSAPQPGPQATTVSGTVLAWTNTGLRGNDPAKLAPVRNLLVSVQGGGQGYTDAQGAFSIPHTGTTAVPVVVEFRGRYVGNVVPTQGTKMRQQVNVTPGTPANITIYTPSVAEFDLSQSTGYWAVDEVNEYMRSVNGTVPSGIGSMTVNTNLTNTCNAYYTRNTINFYNAGPTCNNTAFSTVIFHEWGHGLDDQYGGISQTDGLSEGWADIIAIYCSGQPVVGDYFRTNGGIVRTALNTLTYPVNSTSVHTQGQTWMGFAWDLRTNLIASKGQAAGVAIAEKIVLGSLGANARNQPNAVREVFIADDDDNNLNNGTPNYADLEKAALKRTLPYPKRLSQNPGTWVPFGVGCAGTGSQPAVCQKLNDAGSNANYNTRANLTYALKVTAQQPLTLTGFELNTGSNTSGTANIPIRIYDADSSGRPNRILGSGTMQVGSSQGWYVGNLTQPVLIAQNTDFFIATVNPTTPIDASVMGGSTNVSYFRNDGANNSWNGPLSGFAWAYRLRCASSGKIVPTLANTGVPELGKSFDLNLGLAAKNSAVLLFLGGSNTQYGALPLPLDLTGVGAAGCTLYTSLDILYPTLSDGLGNATVSIAVPSDPLLENGVFYSQALILDAQANQFGLVLTRAGTSKIGKE
jgi:hypothetical protein